MVLELVREITQSSTSSPEAAYIIPMCGHYRTNAKHLVSRWPTPIPLMMSRSPFHIQTPKGPTSARGKPPRGQPRSFTTFFLDSLTLR